MDFVMGLPISTDWKNERFNSILIIIDYITKIVYYKPVKVTIDRLNLIKVIINIAIYYHSIFKSII